MGGSRVGFKQEVSVAFWNPGSAEAHQEAYDDRQALLLFQSEICSSIFFVWQPIITPTDYLWPQTEDDLLKPWKPDEWFDEWNKWASPGTNEAWSKKRRSVLGRRPRANALLTSFKEGLKNEAYLSFIVTPSKGSLSCCEGFRKVCIFFRTNLYLGGFMALKSFFSVRKAHFWGFTWGGVLRICTL